MLVKIGTDVEYLFAVFCFSHDLNDIIAQISF